MSFPRKLYGMPEYAPSGGQMPESVQKLWRTERKFSQTQSELQEAISLRSNTPSEAQREIQLKDSEIERLRSLLAVLRSELNQQREELHDKNIQIKQQEATISIHSNVISKQPERLSNFNTPPPRYPCDYVNHSQSRLPPPLFDPQSLDQSHYSHPPPHTFHHNEKGPPIYSSLDQCRRPSEYTLPIEPARRTKWGTINGNQPPANLARAQTTPANAFASPQQQGRHGANSQGSPVPFEQSMNSLAIRDPRQNGHSAFSTPPQIPQEAHRSRDSKTHTPSTSNGSGGALMRQDVPARSTSVVSTVSEPRSIRAAVISYTNMSREKVITRAYAAFYDLVVRFAFDHVNVPSNQGDSAIPQHLKQRLITAATQTTAARIMSSQQTRFFLVAKVMIEWVHAFVFREDAFLEFNETIATSIKATRAKIFPQTPQALRYVFLQDIAKQFVQLMKIPGYEDFVINMRHRRANDLWNVVRPLKYQQTDGDWQDMHNLMLEAHKLAELQFSNPAEYRYYFPKIADAYNEASMFNMDEDFRTMQPDEIMAQRTMVRLGALPQVMTRVTTADGTLKTMTLLKAGVLLRVNDHQRR